jgi:hypothetical protein
MISLGIKTPLVWVCMLSADVWCDSYTLHHTYPKISLDFCNPVVLCSFPWLMLEIITQRW